MTGVDVVLVRHGAVNSNGRCYGQRYDVACTPPDAEPLDAVVWSVTCVGCL